ncbi:hypothetical protein KCU72_g31, partial [Aureobasidium melanogenum]
MLGTKIGIGRAGLKLKPPDWSPVSDCLGVRCDRGDARDLPYDTPSLSLTGWHLAAIRGFGKGLSQVAL